MNLLKIKELAENRAGGLKKVAKDIGMSEANLHRCINSNKIQATDLEKTASLFGVPVSYFFEDAPVNQQINVRDNAGGAIKMVGGDDYSKTALCPRELQEAQREVASLKERLTQNEKLLEEKERTIQILLQK